MQIFHSHREVLDKLLLPIMVCYFSNIQVTLHGKTITVLDHIEIH